MALFASSDAGGGSAGKRQTPRSTPNGSDHPARGAEIGRARESHERRQGAERTRTSARSVVPRSGDQTALCLDARVWTTAPPGLGVGEVFVAAVGVSAHAARLVVGRYGAGIRGAPVPPLEDVLFVGLLHELLLSFDEFGVLEDMLDEQEEFGLLSLEELAVLEELDALGEPDPFAEVDVDDCAPVVGAVLVSPVVAFELFGADAPAGSRDIPVRALPGASRSWVTHGSVEEGGGAAAGRGSTDASGPGSCVPGKVQSQMLPSCEPTRLPTSWPKVLAGSLFSPPLSGELSDRRAQIAKEVHTANRVASRKGLSATRSAVADGGRLRLRQDELVDGERVVFGLGHLFESRARSKQTVRNDATHGHDRLLGDAPQSDEPRESCVGRPFFFAGRFRCASPWAR